MRAVARGLLTPRFLTITAATYAYFVSIGLLLPVLPRFVERDLGGGGVEVGVAVGAFAVSAALLRPLVGWVGDRHGRRVLAVGGALTVGVASLVLAPAATLAVVVVARLVAGAGEAAVFVGNATAVQDLAPADRRGEATSYFSVALYGGLASGPPLGEWLYGEHGATAVFLLAAAACAVAAVLGMAVPGGGDPTARRPRQLVHPAARRPGAVLLLGLIPYAAFGTFVALYADEVGASAGPLFAVYAGLILAVRIFGARIPDRFGAIPVATVAMGAIGLGAALFALVPTPLGLLAATVVFAGGMALQFPALFSLVVNAAPDRERSHAVGSFSLFFDLSQGLGALGLGALVALAGERAAFAAGAVAAVAGLLVLRSLAATVQIDRSAPTPEPVG